MSERDTLRRFLFEDTGVRGTLVHLDGTLEAVLARHPYPPPVARLLGETLAAGALLGALLKFKGSVTLQVQGDGPVHLLVVQVTPGRTLRGLARWREEPAPEASPDTLLGEGRLVITVDPGEGNEQYQGIVELAGDSLAESLEHYFARSEQLPTRLWLTGDGRRAAGMLLQHLPGPEPDPDAWNRLSHLGSTLTPGELLDLPAERLLRRLYHEEDVRLFDAEPVAFRCTCSRDRIVEMLRMLGREEVESVLAEQGGRVDVDCEFCNAHYTFDAVDVALLWHPTAAGGHRQAH